MHNLLKDYAQMVKTMRDAQGNYFANAGKFRKTNDPDAREKMKKFLAISKEFEARVDQLTVKILNKE